MNFLSVKLSIFSYPTVFTYVLGAQKNRLIETILLSTTPGRRRSKILSKNADQKPIETVFLIAFCRQCGHKWQLKNSVLDDFYLRSSIVVAFSIAAYPV